MCMCVSVCVAMSFFPMVLPCHFIIGKGESCSFVNFRAILISREVFELRK